MSTVLARRLLVVDDDRTFRLSISELLRQEGYDVHAAADAAQAAQALQDGAFDLLLLDVRMPGVDGISLLEILRKRGEDIPVLMISGFSTVDAVVQSLHLAADDFLTKPVDPDVLAAKVAELLERHPGRATRDSGPVPGMVGHSSGMRRVFDAVRQVAPMHSTVLVTGETGTGKELIARAIHELSARATRVFIPVNCAALADGLLESELFGHVRGAFTGAVRDKRGLLAAADGGTLFLDEVADMSLRLQQRLLRAVQDGEITPVGEVRPLKVDVRIVAATNRELRDEVRAGRFREDLFYRLNVFGIALPPLRERAADIPLLADAALRRARERMPAPGVASISPYAIRLLRAYDWPGNIRELFATIESAAIRAAGRRIEAHHLPEQVRGSDLAEAASRYRTGIDPQEEIDMIREALSKAEGVRARAADSLGMSRTTLWRKMREYGLDQ